MQVIFAMQQLLSLIEKRIRPFSRAHGLSPEDCLLLAWLQRTGSNELHALARRTGRKKQSLRRGLQRLEARGLVSSCLEDDRDRIASWAITSEGRRHATEIAAIFHRIESRLFGTAEGKAQMVRHLDTLASEIAWVTGPVDQRDLEVSHFCPVLDQTLPPLAEG